MSARISQNTPSPARPNWTRNELRIFWETFPAFCSGNITQMAAWILQSQHHPGLVDEAPAIPSSEFLSGMFNGSDQAVFSITHKPCETSPPATEHCGQWGNSNSLLEDHQGKALLSCNISSYLFSEFHIPPSLFQARGSAPARGLQTDRAVQ